MERQHRGSMDKDQQNRKLNKESEDESDESEDERQRREREERKEKERKKEREESKRSKAPATVDEELVFATHGSYRARYSGTRLHLCEVHYDGTKKPWEDTVSAIRATAAVRYRSDFPLSVPGVKVLRVRSDGLWDAMVGGLNNAESRGHKTVAVMAGWGDFESLSNHIAALRDNAATDVWLLAGDTSWLRKWQQELNKDSRYQLIN